MSTLLESPSGEEQSILNQELFEEYASLIRDRTGIVIAANSESRESRLTMLGNRLAKPMEKAGARGYAQYLERLRRLPGRSPAWIDFIHAVSTHKTEFFREPAHFRVLRDLVLERARRHRQYLFHFWSAACSTGEEPYSIAIAFDEAVRQVDLTCRVRIIATDIDEIVLKTGARGIYPNPDPNQLSQERLHSYFQLGIGKNNGSIRVKPQIQDNVRFDVCNLTQPPFPVQAPCDAIFCRNVLIYFDEAMRRAIVRNLAKMLAPHGLLILGHAESMAWDQELEAVAPTVYRSRQPKKASGS